MKKLAALLISVGIIFYLVIQIVIYIDLIYPYSHFDFHKQYERYSIYSDRVIDRKTTAILDDVSKRLEMVEINEPEREFVIFICESPLLYKRFAVQTGKSSQSQGFHIQPLNYTFINSQFIKETRKKYHNTFPHSLLNGDPAHIITHELIHELIAKHVGFIQSRSISSWKVEGYAEYYASLQTREADSAYSFKTQLDKYYSGAFQQLGPGHQHYLISRIHVEYLLSEKQLSAKELFDSDLTFENVENDLSDWYKSQKNGVKNPVTN